MDGRIGGGGGGGDRERVEDYFSPFIDSLCT